MKDELKQARLSADDDGSLLVLAVLALIVGAISGLVGAIFRLSLERADYLRNVLIEWAYGLEAVGFFLVLILCAAATALAAWLVRRFSPQASGSGIPHVEAVIRGELPQAPFWLIPVKFVGGLLAIGAGLALGREGPSVQMGASSAHLVGKLFRRTWPDCRVLIAAGAGAGLATAFNAPIAGAVFVLEELVQRFEHRIAIAALGASATAIGIARVLIGDAPDFHVSALGYAHAGTTPLYFVFGALAGLLAVIYSRALLATIATAHRLNRLPTELRAGLVGAAVGVLAWFAPDLVGGGMRSPSAFSPAAYHLPLFRPPFWFGLDLARYPTPPERQAACSRPCWYWERNSDCFLRVPVGSCYPIWTFSLRLLRSSGWPPSSQASCELPLPASCWLPR